MNPKQAGSKSYARFDVYKAATSVAEFRALGGTAADLKHDLAKGFIALAK